MSINIEKP